MTQTLATIRANVQSILDEVINSLGTPSPNPRFWTNLELNNWINEGCRDISRRSEDLQSFNTSIVAIAGTAKYTLPIDCLRVHRVEFVPTGQSQTYPLKHSTYQEMDAIWGINQQIQSAYPYYFVMWGFPPTLQIQFYPVPAQAGTFNVFYYRLPITLVADGDVAEIPSGWEDLITLYCEFNARRKNRDPMWQDVRQVYEQSLANLIDTTRQWHDQSRMITVATGLGIPGWLYDGGSEWW
jgi:hypothetical protein